MSRKENENVAKSEGRRPAIRGRNTPKDVHKAFRSHGNGVVVKAALEHDRRGYGYKSDLA